MNAPEQDRLALVLIRIAAVVCLVWGTVKLVDLFASFFANHGGSGLGSAGAPETLEYLAPAFFSAVLSAYVRDRRPYGRVLHRAFVFATLVPIALIVLVIAVGFKGAFARGVNGAWLLLFGSAFVASTLWLPMQVFFLLAFLSLLTVPRVPAA
jgi:hypothetical protein